MVTLNTEINGKVQHVLAMKMTEFGRGEEGVTAVLGSATAAISTKSSLKPLPIYFHLMLHKDINIAIFVYCGENWNALLDFNIVFQFSYNFFTDIPENLFITQDYQTLVFCLGGTH